MMRCLLNGVLSGIAIRAMVNCRRLSVQLLKIEAAKWYLHGVQMARFSAIGLMGLGLIIALIGVGLLLLHAGLFILLPWTMETKAILGLSLGVAYVVIGVFALRAAIDEKAWMEKSGASRMLDEAIRPSRMD